MTVPLLALDHVARSFDGGRIVALRDTSLAIAAGECVAITGRSGSGKSCLLNIASGLDAPTAGVVRWRGAVVRARRDWAAIRNREIGIVFQEFHLLPTLTAIENVQVPLVGSGIGAAALRRRAAEALAQVGLQDRLAHQPQALSGGERQRVAIARALVRDPALLLADEPTGALDSGNAEMVAALMLRLWQERRMTLVLITHDIALAARCPRRIRLHDGVVAEDSGAPA